MWDGRKKFWSMAEFYKWRVMWAMLVYRIGDIGGIVSFALHFMYRYASFQSATGSLCVAISSLARCASAVCQATPASCCSRILYFAHGVISYSVVGLSPREEAPQTSPHRQDDASGQKGNIIRQFYSLHWSATTTRLDFITHARSFQYRESFHLLLGTRLCAE